MDLSRLIRIDGTTWQIEPTGAMRVPLIYAGEGLVREMDEKVYEQTVNVASLPGIVKAAYVMPDAHWGYGFPIGGVWLSMQMRVGWFQPEELALTFPAACAQCFLT